MSADAKAWNDPAGGWNWRGLHDGDCSATIPHDQGGSLSDLLIGIEQCMGHALRWEIRAYPDGHFGLSGYRC